MTYQFDASRLDNCTIPDACVYGTVAFSDGRKFHILPADTSRPFQVAMQQRQRAMERGPIDQETAQSIMHRLYANYIVIDWEGIEDTDGGAIPYSAEAAEAYFKAFPKVFDQIVRKSWVAAVLC